MVAAMVNADPNELPERPGCESREVLRSNLAAIQARIETAAREAGRDPAEVKLLPVSKTVDLSRIRWAYEAGVRTLGENKVQEAREKSEALADLADLRWAVIGHLQTNKAKYVARFASEFHALDSLKLAAELDRRLEIEDRTLEVMIQVNSSGEESKFGLRPDEVVGFAAELAAFERLRLRGLMTLALNSPDREAVRGCFVLMRELRDRMREEVEFAREAGELSMGMSGDFELAIAEGATIVRVGSAIFGARPNPQAA
jgi:pyridoxal phosphate enzyme (YggS family)